MRHLIFTLILISTTTWAGAETHRVKPSDSNRLPQMFERLEDGDTVIFERGTYTIHKTLQLSGRTNVTLKAQGKVEIELTDLDAPVIGISDSSRIKVEGLRARHQKPADEYICEGAVISVHQSERVGISTCELNGCGAAGVYGRSVKDLVIYNNTIFNNTFAGLWFNDVTGTVHQNRIFKNASSIITYGTCDISFTGNEIKDNEGNVFNDTSFFREIVESR